MIPAFSLYLFFLAVLNFSVVGSIVGWPSLMFKDGGGSSGIVACNLG